MAPNELKFHVVRDQASMYRLLQDGWTVVGVIEGTLDTLRWMVPAANDGADGASGHLGNDTLLVLRREAR